ncbi:Autolytic lysozyme [Seminavis robusta]|uniref:Autolytic lysozyme n=1 Tax=Seminavis robusta TaxID=568900 RepID=A0A9N8DRL9_9STRA|nr:Autolytic lysozyme [Seminavis robusta]|eukprot:Sro302_g112260.1 Autolytic lysozyme (185) ;mRNA; f:58235-58789
MDPPVERVKGCDVSHWNGVIDWATLRSRTDLKFVFIKATQGTTYVDPKFRENWGAAKKHGLFRGAYHFFQSDTDPQLQAEHFLSVVSPQQGDFSPTLDVEIAGSTTTVEELTRGVRVWVQTVQGAIGRPPMIYTNKTFGINGFYPIKTFNAALCGLPSGSAATSLDCLLDGTSGPSGNIRTRAP